jgi:hypothetical protein
MDRIRETARKRLSDIVQQSAHFGSDSAAQKFASDIDAAVAEKCPTPRRYRDRVLFLTANLPNVADELGSMTADFLSTVSETELKSARQKSADDREARKRARLKTIELKDRDDVKCVNCGLPIRSRLNMNRFDVEDEVLGQQYQNQYDVLCECDADKDPTAGFGEESEEEPEEGDAEGAVETKSAADDSSPTRKALRAEASR